ncbi:helix-turn-helix domain-containing protein [Alkaliphilus transvaalensis]|uniref:helix-turn-helix domain-containing protein n=1 Tax=Alkaliphilus transvaalensis TaxID=114628 RepID=UPI000478BE27|nr:helix-turn-helix transcriptional regulator [Alkaliphilus transvaalensis]
MAKRIGPGEKIKRLRLAMGLTQDALTKDELSKSIVSMIESNKRNLTWHTAQIIADCLNVYYERLGQKITAEYLMETEEDEARRTIKEDIKHLQEVIDKGNVDQQLLENTFDKILNHIKTWGLEKELADFKIIRGNFYYHNYQYNEALTEYLDVLEYALRSNDHGLTARMYNSIACVYKLQMNLDTALIHYVKAYDTARVYKPKDEAKRKVLALYNQILCYRLMKRYDLALSHINLLRGLKWDDPYFKVILDKTLLIEGSTYRDIGNYEKALKTYDKLQNNERELNKETLFLLYDNYAELFLLQKKPREALVFVHKANEIKKEVNINYLPDLYLMEAKCYSILKDYDLVVSLLENALHLAHRVGKERVILDMHFAFADLYLKTKDYETALAHLETAEKTIIEKDLSTYKADLYSFYSNIYLKLGDDKKVEEYLIKMRRSFL